MRVSGGHEFAVTLSAPPGLISVTTQPEVRAELVRLVRGQAARAQSFDEEGTLDRLRSSCYRTLIRACIEGVVPADTDLQASADLIAGAVWSRVVHGEEVTEAHAAAVVDAILPESA